MKTIGIIGSRRRDTVYDLELVRRAVTEVFELGDRLVSGGCPRGGDRFAEEIARWLQCTITIHHAEWDRLGKRAGFVRNGDIARDADILIACVAHDRTGGTEDTIRKFKALGKEQLILV